MRNVLVLMLAGLAIGACAEINRPITPNDPWREKAVGLPAAVPR